MSTVLIAGANRGLGLEYARQYLADGWDVIATARDVSKAGELAALGGIEIYPLDIANMESVQALAGALTGRSLDVVICNAGIYGPDNQSLLAMDYDGWLRTFDINTLGPFRLSEALRANLKAASGKRAPKLALMTSRMGSIAEADGPPYAYCSSKAALNMVGHSLAAELKADGIVVLLLHPGWVQTDMGGANAPLKTPESITGLRKVIANAGLAQAGSYLDYSGKQLDW